VLTNEQLKDAKKFEDEKNCEENEIITILLINLHVYEKLNCLINEYRIQ
jgi:hypothetical protein